NLLDLDRVRAHRSERGIESHLERHVLPDQPPKELIDSFHHIVQVERARLQDLLPAEREELRREGARPLPSSANLVHVRAAWFVGWGPSLQELAVAEDRREKVVEVVRDPTRELADRAELLGLEELLLESLSLADIFDDAGEVIGIFRFPEHRRDRHLAPDRSAIPPEKLVLRAIDAIPP